MAMWNIILFLLFKLLTDTNAAFLETKFKNLKPNIFDPVLSSHSYIGHIKENERIVKIEPRLYALDSDPSNSLNGQICGYELSLHKHDDSNNKISSNIPFTIEIIDEQAVMKLKSNIETIDCENQQVYHLFIRAYDCAHDDERRYSERSAIKVMIDDVNEYRPIFTNKHYLFKLYQDQTCQSCRVEATDDDCENINNRVCGYQILTPNVPFSIDSNGSIAIDGILMETKYEFDVIALDCYPSSLDNETKVISDPVKVTVQLIQSCKPRITDESPTKLTIQADHTHVFDNIHFDICDQSCALQDIVATVTLDRNGLDSGCNIDQCLQNNHEYVLIRKDVDYDKAPTSSYFTFEDGSQASPVDKNEFSGQFNNEFIVRMWMKHKNQESNEKEHIFCKSDETLRNRHHTALLIQGDYLKLLIRKGPTLSNDKKLYPSEWIWKLEQINDNQWHSYKFFVYYPNRVDLYIDDQLFPEKNDTFQIISDYALPIIDETETTKFVIGACWHGRSSHMAQAFHGQLSGLSIEQKEELKRSNICIQDCKQYLDIPDIDPQIGTEFISNSNRSVWVIRTDSSESFEQLLKHIVYRNTFLPIGPSGQRTVSVQTKIKCLPENITYDLPTFNRRLSIEEIISPVNIQLKGDTNFVLDEQIINQGIYLFQNLTIITDASDRNQVDITDCSIHTTPDLSISEQLIVPNDNFHINNLQTDRLHTGLIFSGLGSIESYQNILRKIIYISKSPLASTDRTFSLVCLREYDKISTNQLYIRIHVERKTVPSVHAAAVASNQLYVNNDKIKDNLYNIMENTSEGKNVLGWPIAVVICVSVGLASLLVIYLVIRMRFGHKQTTSTKGTGDEINCQMEWEDDIGLNIIVNPLEETKKPVQPMNNYNIEQTIPENECTSSDEDYNDENDHIDCSSDEDDDDDDGYNYGYGNNSAHQIKSNHQLEWDDEVMEYGPKKV